MEDVVPVLVVTPEVWIESLSYWKRWVIVPEAEALPSLEIVEEKVVFASSTALEGVGEEAERSGLETTTTGGLSSEQLASAPLFGLLQSQVHFVVKL